DGGLDVRLCVNLDEDELADPALAELIAETAAEAGVPVSALQLELRARSLRRHAEKLEELRERGAFVALDGFGVDPVSLSLLSRAPIDGLKIARSLIEALGEEGDGDAASAAVIGMGNRLGLHVTAEGVETEAQADRVREMGCDALQGFFIGRPRPAAALESYLADRLAT